MNDCYYIKRDYGGFCERPGGGFDWWTLVAILAVALMFIGLVTGCKTKTQVVTVPEYHTEYIVRSDTIARVDSVLVRDSVYIYNVGDTIIVNKVMYRDRVRNVYKTRTDTLLRRDSVRVPYPVEKELTKAQQRYIAIGKRAAWAVAAFAALALLAVIVWLAKKLRQK